MEFFKKETREYLGSLSVEDHYADTPDEFAWSDDLQGYLVDQEDFDWWIEFCRASEIFAKATKSINLTYDLYNQDAGQILAEALDLDASDLDMWKSKVLDFFGKEYVHSVTNEKADTLDWITSYSVEELEGRDLNAVEAFLEDLNKTLIEE